MRVEGDTLALRRLFDNEEALMRGERTPHRILLIGTGGGMCCTRAAGYLTAFKQHGITEAIDHAVTVSGSGGAVGAFLSGMPHRASRMFEQLAASGFVQSGSYGVPRLQLDFLADILRGVHSPLAFSDDAIRSHRTSWHVVVTRMSGESLMLDAKRFAPDVAQAVLASSALPEVATPVSGGLMGDAEEQWVDGACGMPLPLRAGVTMFRPDTVIILESRPDQVDLSRIERLLWPTLTHFCLRHAPGHLRRQLASMNRFVDSEMGRLRALKRIKWCRVIPDRGDAALSPFTADGVLLHSAAENARHFMGGVLEAVRPKAVV
ncbi:MAG: hypothetical protein AAGJ70_08465 [Pseudomonadota bacterium]